MAMEEMNSETDETLEASPAVPPEDGVEAAPMSVTQPDHELVL